MKAVKILKPWSSAEVVEIDKPIPKKGEVLLKVKLCGFCGSDFQVHRGTHPMAKYPVIPGHEIAALVIEVKGWKKLFLKKGTIVTVDPYKHCGKCYACQNEMYNCCENNETMGVQRNGGFAEYIVAPYEKVYKADKLGLSKACLVEPTAIAFHAINRIGFEVSKNHNILIVGDGAIGVILSTVLSKANVLLAGKHRSRLETAAYISKIKTVNIVDEGVRFAVSKLTKKNKMDICIEATGTPKGFHECIDCVSNGGTVILIGNSNYKFTISQADLVKKELNIFASRNALPEDFYDAIKFLRKNNKITSIAQTTYLGIEAAKKAFHKIINGDRSSIKTFLAIY